MEAWLRFFHDCDWNRDWTVRNLEAVREHAYMIVTAWAGDEMVGTLTVLSDGMNYATIDDVVVGGGWRRDPDLIRLHAIPGVEAFYERLGFARINETPMHLTP
jgi:hypothetical protein